MFTVATRHFGVWRENHVSRRRYAGSPTYGLAFALGVGAFVAWLVLFLVLKIRTEFFLVESAPFPLVELQGSESSLSPAQPVSLVAALLPGENPGTVHLVFGEGQHFLFPEERETLLKFLSERQKRIEYLSMLTLSLSPAVSRVQLWPARGVGGAELEKVVALFSRFGFDAVDVAVRLRKGK